jgi:hypothetical protein
LKLLALLIGVGGALLAVVAFFKLLGFWGALLLLFLLVFGATRG